MLYVAIHVVKSRSHLSSLPYQTNLSVKHIHCWWWVDRHLTTTATACAFAGHQIVQSFVNTVLLWFEVDATAIVIVVVLPSLSFWSQVAKFTYGWQSTCTSGPLMRVQKPASSFAVIPCNVIQHFCWIITTTALLFCPVNHALSLNIWPPLFCNPKPWECG